MSALRKLIRKTQSQKHKPLRKSTLHLESLEQRFLLTAQYTLTDLGTLGGNFDIARGINDAGQVTGHGEVVADSGLWSAFIWEEGQMSALGTSAFPGNTQSYAYDINNTGYVAGAMDVLNNQYRAFRYDGDYVWNIHPGSGDNTSYGMGINDSGKVAGYYNTPGGANYGFIWNSSGTEYYQSSQCQIYDINSSDVAAGKVDGGSGYYHAAIFEDGSITDIDPDAPYSSEALGINQSGQVAGWRYSGFGKQTDAFVWDSTNGLQTLGSLGDYYTEAYAINDSGAIVGSSRISLSTTHAFIYENGVMKDLNQLVTNSTGWDYLYTAYDINNSGQIVGAGVKTGSLYFQAFLLTPIEEPDTESPTAVMAADDITADDESTYTFEVTYSDNEAIDVSTIDDSDVRVTGPGVFDETATLVSVDIDSDGTPRTALYEIDAPGGTWDVNDNGDYQISILASQVGDTGGHFVVAGQLDTFTVNITPPLPSEQIGPMILSHSPSAAPSGGFSAIDVTFDKPINASTLTAADVSLLNPNSNSITISSVSSIGGNSYRINFASQTEPGDYSLRVGPNVNDTNGNAMNQDSDSTNGEPSDYYSAQIRLNPDALTIISQTPTGTVSGTVDEITMTFSNAINTGTFTAADVSLTGPGGTIPVTGVVLDSGNTWRILFSDQSDAGTYSFSVGPNINNMFGVAMNQDGDETPGEPGQDAYTGQFIVSASTLKITSHSPTTRQEAGLDYADVIFSEAILQSTFTKSDVTITGPDDAVTVSSVEKISSTKYRLHFPMQTAYGNVTITVGADIATAEGAKMNQDGDDTAGETPDDSYIAVIPVGQQEAKTGIVITGMVTNEIHVAAGDITGSIPLQLFFQNYGPYSDSGPVYYYLSSDANVDRNDQEFYAGNFNRTWDNLLDVGESRRISENWQTPDTPGTYYMKALFRGDQDTWSDLITIYVESSSAKPLICITDLQAGKTSVQAGESFTWTMTVTNNGSVDYIKDSLNEKINGDIFDPAAYVCRWVGSNISGTFEIDYIPAGGSVTATYTDYGRTPSWGDSIEYNVRFTSNLYSNVTNPYSDFTSERVTITSSNPAWPAGKPDLVATINANIPDLAMPGDEIEYSITVANQGVTASGKNYVIMYRSTDDNVDRSDVALNEEFLPDFTVPALLPGQSVTLHNVMAVPHGQGTYYLAGKADCGVSFYSRNDVNESNEDNNWTNVLEINVGNAQATADVAWPRIDENTDLAELNDKANHYIEVNYSNADPASINGNEITLSGTGAGSAAIGKMTKVDDDTYRYEVKGSFEVGLVDVQIVANSFTNNSNDSNAAETESFGALPDLDPLQISVDTKTLSWDPVKKQFQYSGDFGIGLKPPQGQSFTPVMNASGDLGFDGNKINFSGIVSMVIFGQETTLYEGDFTFDVGSLVTSSLTDAAGQLPNEFTVAGTEIKLAKIEFAIPDGKTVVDTQLELQGSVKLPDDMGGFELSITDPHKLIVSPTAGVSLSGGKLTLPDLEIFMFGGELKMMAKDMSVEYIAEITTPQPKPSALRFRGSVSLPYFYNATASFTGDDSYIEVTRLGGVDWYGTLSVEDIVIVPGQWEINKALLGMKKDDKDNYITECEAKMTLPTGIALGGKIHFINGDINFIELEADNINKPLGVTGAFLQRIMGHVDHVSEYEEPKLPISFGGSVGITAGPQITVPLPAWIGLGDKVEGVLVGLDLSADVDENHLTGHGYIEIVSGLVQGNVNAELNWKDESFSASIDLDALQGLITADASLFIDYSKAFDTTDIFAAGKGAVKIPKVIPLWGGVELGAANMKLQYRDDNTDKNDYILGWGKILVSEYHNYYLTGGIKVGFDGSYEFVGGKEIVQFTAQAKSKGMTVLGTTAGTADYLVEADTPWLLMGADWNNDNDNVTVEVVDPQGHVYTENDFASLDNIFIVDAMSDASGKAVYVHQPEEGTWTIRLISDQALTNLTLSSMVQAPLPEIEITGVEINDRSQEITIDYAADWSGNDTVINFYYDTDYQDADGFQLAGDITPTDNGSYVWDASSVPAGSYYIYAEIMDASNAPVTAYWSQVIAIEDAPAGVDVEVGDGLAKSVTYTDSDGTLVTVKVIKGQATLSFTGDTLEKIISKKGVEITGDNVFLKNIDLFNSSEATSITLTGKGGSIAGSELGGVTGDSLGKLNAKGIDLVGDIDLDGSLGSLTLDDIADNVSIVSAQAFSKGFSIKADQIGEDVLFNLAGGIGNFQVNEYADGAVKADSISKITIKLGDFGPDVEATTGDLLQISVSGDIQGDIFASGNIKKISSKSGALTGNVQAGGNIDGIQVAGNISGDISADGLIKTISTKGGDFTGTLRAGLDIAALQAVHLKDAVISSGRDIQNVTLKGDIRNSFILGGYDIGADALFGGGDAMNSGNVKSVSAKGTFADSYIAAGVLPSTSLTSFLPDAGEASESRTGSIGKMSFGSIDFDTDTDFGLFAADQIATVKFGRQKTDASIDHFLMQIL